MRLRICRAPRAGRPCVSYDWGRHSLPPPPGAPATAAGLSRHRGTDTPPDPRALCCANAAARHYRHNPAYRLMPSSIRKTVDLWPGSSFYTTLLEAFQEGQQVIIRLVATGSTVHRRGLIEGLLLELKTGMQIHLGGVHRLMTEPHRDHRTSRHRCAAAPSRRCGARHAARPVCLVRRGSAAGRWPRVWPADTPRHHAPAVRRGCWETRALRGDSAVHAAMRATR